MSKTLCVNNTITYFQEIKSETVQLSEFTLKLIISMNITYTGTLICKASNRLGTFIKRYTVLVAGMMNLLIYFINTDAIC